MDHSTTDIASAEHLATIITDQARMPFVDVPVSGGPAATEGGTLAIMAGGSDDAIATVTRVMENLGRFTHVEP